MPGAARRIDRLQGALAASGGQSQSGPRHHAERHRSAHLAAAGQTRHRRRRAQLAGPGLPPRRRKIRVTSSISRQLIFWLAVPLMLLALCGALLHYFNSVAPEVISSERRLREAANTLMAHVQIKDGRINFDASPDLRPPLPAAASIRYALRDGQARLLAGDGQIPAVPMNDSNAQVFAIAQIDRRSLRTLTTRFNTALGG